MAQVVTPSRQSLADEAELLSPAAFLQPSLRGTGTPPNLPVQITEARTDRAPAAGGESHEASRGKLTTEKPPVVGGHRSVNGIEVAEAVEGRRRDNITA